MSTTPEITLEIMKETIKIMKENINTLTLSLERELNKMEENIDVISTKLIIRRKKCIRLSDKLRYFDSYDSDLTDDEEVTENFNLIVRGNISDELATFIGQPIGSKMLRTEVTRELSNYIRKHKLQDPHNGRKINPDDKLADLLKIPDSCELTYFNLQKFMSPHFSYDPKS
jgi:upstream activation factor subunit UAF30